jgi:hypothetical protein
MQGLDKTLALFIPDDKQPIYDGWLSVGSTLNQQVSLSDGKKSQFK